MKPVNTGREAICCNGEQWDKYFTPTQKVLRSAPQSFRFPFPIELTWINKSHKVLTMDTNALHCVHSVHGN